MIIEKPRKELYKRILTLDGSQIKGNFVPLISGVRSIQKSMWDRSCASVYLEENVEYVMNVILFHCI